MHRREGDVFQWDDLRYFLVTARTGSTSRAARDLRVNQSTVSRRIKALEDALDVSLFARGSQGLRLQPDGERLLAQAEKMEEIASTIGREMDQASDRIEGTVKVTTIEEIASLLIAPALPEFHRRWPNIQLKLHTSHRVLDLTRGEADVSLRMGRPSQVDLVARKVGGFGYAVFTSQAYLDNVTEKRLEDLQRLDWITLDGALPTFPEVSWFRGRLPDVSPIMRSSSVKTLVTAVQAGLGVAILPRPYKYLYEGLVRLPIDTGEIYREIWLVVHRDLQKVRAVQVVLNFLEEVMNKPLK